MPTLVLRDTNVSDGYASKLTPTTNNSTGTSLYMSGTSSADIQRILIKFGDLVPPGGTVTVSAATLSFTNADAAGSTRAVEVRKFLQPWTLAQFTWNNRLTGTPWAVAGALGGAEVDATVLATGTAPTTTTSFNLTGAGLIAYCQAVMNGGVDHGLIVNCLDDATVFDGVTRRFRKSAFATAGQRPTLTIDYTTGTPVNWTINSPTVNSDAGTVTLTVTLDAPAPGGGFSGLVNTYDITAVAGVDYTAQVNVPFSISAGNTTGNIVIPILP